MSTFKRLGLSALLACGLMVTAGASAASAGIDPTGPFEFEAGATRFTINDGMGNPSSSYVECSESYASGDADDLADDDSGAITLTFTGTCATQMSSSASITCDDPSGALEVVSSDDDSADVGVDIYHAACQWVIGSNLCVMRWFAGGTHRSARFDEGAPGTLTIPSPTAVPFTSSGGFCGLIGIPSSGTMRWQPPAGGNLVFMQSAGDPITATP